MKLKIFIALLFITNAIIAQKNNKQIEKSTIVTIKNIVRIRILDLPQVIYGNSLGDGDSATLVEQLGLAKYKILLKRQNSKDLPKCIQQFLENRKGNPFHNFSIAVIAEYTHTIMDEKEWQCILEVSVQNNEKVKGKCVVKKTFYIAIPQEELNPYIHLIN